MNKAVFLDRDGVVNVERGEYTWRIEDFSITIGLVEFLKWANERNFLLIVISNQGCIGKGVCSQDDVEKAHQYLKSILLKQEIELTDIYYCPHHPNTGKCLCRKPESVLLEKAIARYRIDISRSVFIGDTQRDMDAGNKVGVPSLLIKPNASIMDYISEIERLTGLV